MSKANKSPILESPVDRREDLEYPQKQKNQSIK